MQVWQWGPVVRLRHCSHTLPFTHVLWPLHWQAERETESKFYCLDIEEHMCTWISDLNTPSISWLPQLMHPNCGLHWGAGSEPTQGGTNSDFYFQWLGARRVNFCQHAGSHNLHLSAGPTGPCFTESFLNSLNRSHTIMLIMLPVANKQRGFDTGPTKLTPRVVVIASWKSSQTH